LARRAEGAWRWPNFSPAEIACRGTGKLLINEPALDKLQALRDRLGKPLIVRSAYRSPEHNRAVGGATRSKHLDGAAFDIAMANHDPVAFEAAARAVGFLGFGFYPRSGFMHMSTSGLRGSGASGSPSGRRPSPRRRRPRARFWPTAAP
jgi:zinc D-Ala-D-Ala carboxypeptidase